MWQKSVLRRVFSNDALPFNPWGYQIVIAKEGWEDVDIYKSFEEGSFALVVSRMPGVKTHEGTCLSKVDVLVAHGSDTTVFSWKIY